MIKKLLNFISFFLEKQEKKSSKNFYFLFFVLFSPLLVSSESYAEKQLLNEVNYFSSIRASEANVRSGPGGNYPVKFSFRLRAIPVRVVSEYDNWNEIEDFEGQRGWISQSLLSKKRSLMVVTKKKFVPLYAKNDERSQVLLHMENYVLGQYQGCVEDWCQIKVNGEKGWVKRSEVFGGDKLEEQSEEESSEGEEASDLRENSSAGN